MPSGHELRLGTIVNGVFYIDDRLGAFTPYSVVRDRACGYNIVRVDWTPEELALPTKERMLIMDNMRLLAEIKYEQLKENNGTPL